MGQPRCAITINNMPKVVAPKPEPISDFVKEYKYSIRFSKKTFRILKEIDECKWWEFFKRRRLIKLIK